MKRIASMILLASLTASAQTVTTVGPTPTGQPGTDTETRKVGPTNGQQTAATAAAAGVMIGGVIALEEGGNAILRVAAKHSGDDKDYKGAYKNCLRREIAAVGFTSASQHGDEMKASCSAYAAQEFPTDKAKKP
jgi:hypothetical protein